MGVTITVIIILFTSIVCCGRRFAVGSGRVATGEGLLNRIIGTSLQRGVTGCKSLSTRARNGAFVSAVTIKPAFSRASSTSNDKPNNNMESSATQQHMTSELCSEEDTCTQQQSHLLSSKVSHPNDSTLWMYHVESTTSTMDEAKFIVEKKFFTDVHSTTTKKNDNADDDNIQPTSFLISATSQTNGRGTTKRNWKSSQRGNALFTIGIPQSSWMSDLKSKNDGKMVPLTLLPLKVGSLVALHTQRLISECFVNAGETQKQQVLPRVTVKWPNDVLLHTNQGSHEKVAGILIESSQDWFLIGIGINIGYAPNIPSQGVDHGRKATCLSQYCNASRTSEEVVNVEEEEEEEYWIKVSKKLATDIAYDLHSWLHPTSSTSLINNDNVYSGEAILNQWKSYIDWNMELTLRDTPKRERVRLKEILEDGRVVVQEIETGLTRTLVSDYFL